MIHAFGFREAWAVRRTASQIWHLSGQMAQKTCTVKEKTFKKPHLSPLYKAAEVPPE
jgi:hypothetical protein